MWYMNTDLHIYFTCHCTSDPLGVNADFEFSWLSKTHSQSSHKSLVSVLKTSCSEIQSDSLLIGPIWPVKQSIQPISENALRRIAFRTGSV